MRKTIQNLVERVVEVRRGKGTFVTQPKITQELTELTGFVEDRFVTSPWACGGVGSRYPADDENQLRRVSFPARGHSPSDMALPPIHS